jgi:hypothetical protein
MKFSEAKQEFQIRYYYWAASEFEKEIDAGYPNLRLFKVGTCREAYRFIQRLDRNGQSLLAHSLLKRFHPEAVKALGESCSVEEESLRDRLDGFRRSAPLFQENSRELAAKAIKSLSKRELLSLMAMKFRDAFGAQCVEADRVVAGDPRLEYQIKLASGWVVSTHFWFGHRENMIEYDHAISSEAAFVQKGPRGPYMANFVIGSMMSFCSWLGISSQTQWKSLTDAEAANHACNATVKLCGIFFEVSPKLLRGLELEKVTA